MWTRILRNLTIVIALLVVSEHRASAQRDSVAQSRPFCCTRHRLATAGADLAMLQVVPWYFNRHHADDSTAMVSPSTWKRNMEQGFEWDPNGFYTNMFMHPFHGNAFFNAARSNGFTHWESTAFAWAGSFIWEFFGENNRPAINDWVNTSMGGIAIGEAFYRTANMVVDNTATGTGRTLRELGALLINPVGGLNRILRGEATKVGSNPEGRLPSRAAGVVQVGLRQVGDGNLGNGRAAAYVDLEVYYGNPLVDFARPFDSFVLALQLNTVEDPPLGRLQIEGMLYGRVISSTERSRQVLGISQHYDYINNETYEVGGQSLSGTLLSTNRLSDRWTLNTKFQLSALVISGINSEYAASTGRSYDFGSGAGIRVGGALNKSGFDRVSLAYVGYWSHTLDGAKGSHLLHFVRARVQFPLLRWFGLGAEGILAVRNSYYRDFPNVHRRNPQLRVYSAFFGR